MLIILTRFNNCAIIIELVSDPRIASLMCHVLVIEDDWLIADHLAYLVQAGGASSVDLADTEDDAFTRAITRPPTVIVTDVRLRDGTGPGAVNRIIAVLGRLPVLFVTGEPRGFIPPSSEMQVLHKPVDDKVFSEAFRSIISLEKCH